MATQEDDQIRDALDQIFRGEGQTYEQFMNRFLFLRQEDVGEPSAEDIDSLESADTHNIAHGSAAAVNGINGCDDYDNVEAPDHSSRERSHSQNSEESLPEENLGPGSQAPSILMRTSETTGGTIVQLDNFVDDEGSPLSDLSPEESEDDEEPSYVFSGHPSEPPPQTGKQSNTSSLPHPSQTRSHSDTAQEISKPSPHTSDEDMCVQLQTENIRERLSCELESKVVKPLPGEVDPEGLQDGMSSPGTTNVRHLGIKTTFRQCPDEHVGQTQQEENEAECCEVEPFSIDEEFDYDNVVLTPKFSFLSSSIS